MMKLIKKIQRMHVLIWMGSILYNQAIGQEVEIPEAHYPKLPEYATTAKGFVPPGWTLEIQKLGDLNGDGRRDLLLVLRENNPKNIIEHQGMGESPLDTNPRILAVAFKKPGSGYALVLQNHEIIGRHVDPTLSDVMRDDGVSVKRGNLLVELHFFANAGSWWMGATTLTFRYLKDSFKLIGYDNFSMHRATLELDKISINYLTGKIKISKGRADDDGQDKVSWKKIPSLKPIPIEKVDENFSPSYGD